MAESADAEASKAFTREGVWVQVPLRAPSASSPTRAASPRHSPVDAGLRDPRVGVRAASSSPWSGTRYPVASRGHDQPLAPVKRGRIERGRIERGRIERGRIERGRIERGRIERGWIDRGRDECRDASAPPSRVVIGRHATPIPRGRDALLAWRRVRVDRYPSRRRRRTLSRPGVTQWRRGPSVARLPTVVDRPTGQRRDRRRRRVVAHRGR